MDGSDKNMINKDTIIVTDWMINEIGLCGDRLIAYAVIYKFSKEKDKYYGGSLRYIANWLGRNTPYARKIVDTLIEDGFVIETEKGLKAINHVR